MHSREGPAPATGQGGRVQSAHAGRRIRIIGRLAAVLIGVLAPLLLLEASLRLLGPWLPGGYDTGQYIVRDEALGHVHAPNFVGWMRGPEFITHIRISPLGLRDSRTTYEKPPGTFRVVLLGDSYVEGVQVQAAETVAYQLERLLNEGAPRRVEVINAGVAAYGTAQQLLFFEQDVQRYQPDVVILFFFAWNDVKNNSYRLEIPGRKLSLALKPYFELEDDGSLTLIPGPPPTPPQPVVGALRRHSWLYNVLEGAVFSHLGPAFVREDIEVVGGAVTPFRGLYSREQSDEWDRAWKLTTALLARLRDRTAQAGAPLLIASVPGWEVDPAWWRQMVTRRDPGAEPRGLDMDLPLRRLGVAAADVGVPYLDLLPPMREATRGGDGPLYYAVDGHWNAAGHLFAARTVAAALIERGLAGR